MSLKTNSHGIQLRNSGEHTTRETRHDAHLSVKKQVRYGQIKSILYTAKRPLSAKEVAQEMYMRGYVSSNDRNNSAPRLTELGYKGICEPVGKIKDQWTGRVVTVWDLTPVARDQMQRELMNG